MAAIKILDTRDKEALQGEIGELSKQVKNVKTIEVSPESPTSDSADIWIDEDSDEEFVIPEIKDDEVSEFDTWSSKKIDGMFSGLSGNAIICTAEGESIVVSDSSDDGFKGLKIFGRTDQGNNPSPDYPQELVNVGASGELKVNVLGDDAQPQTLTHSIPGGLAGIKVTDAAFATYTDADGQMYCADYRDYERGVDVLRVVRDTLDGSENWQPIYNSGGSTIDYFYLNIGNLGDVCNYAIMCDKLPTVVIAAANTNEGIYIVNSSTGFARIIIRIRGLVENSQHRFLEWLAANPLQVQYASKNVKETPIPEAELAAYRELKTNYPITTVLNDSNAYMQVGYSADTKLYINERLSKVTAPQLIDRETGEVYQFYVVSGNLMLEKVKV